MHHSYLFHSNKKKPMQQGNLEKFDWNPILNRYEILFTSVFECVVKHDEDVMHPLSTLGVYCQIYLGP